MPSARDKTPECMCQVPPRPRDHVVQWRLRSPPRHSLVRILGLRQLRNVHFKNLIEAVAWLGRSTLTLAWGPDLDPVDVRLLRRRDPMRRRRPLPHGGRQPGTPLRVVVRCVRVDCDHLRMRQRTPLETHQAVEASKSHAVLVSRRVETGRHFPAAGFLTPHRNGWLWALHVPSADSDHLVFYVRVASTLAATTLSTRETAVIDDAL